MTGCVRTCTVDRIMKTTFQIVKYSLGGDSRVVVGIFIFVGTDIFIFVIFIFVRTDIFRHSELHPRPDNCVR